MSSEARLAKFVRPEITEARLARQWASVLAKSGSRWRPIRWTMAFATIGTLVAIFAAFRVGQRFAQPSSSIGLAGVVFEASDSGGWSSALPGRWRLSLDRGSRFEVLSLGPSEVKLRLLRGAIDLDVAHMPARSVSVIAAGVEVTDIGTRFRVELAHDPVQPRVQVDVENGEVQVRTPQGPHAVRVIRAGEVWTSIDDIAVARSTATTATSPSPVAADASATEPTVAVIGTDTATDDVTAAHGAPQRSHTIGAISPIAQFETLAREHHAAEAYASLGPGVFADELAHGGARQLFELGDVAKIAGHTREAAEAFDALRRRFRSDPRAALASFELGRLRLDSLADPAGAEVAFRDAIQLGPQASFREDAESRRIDALDRLHSGECVTAREAYLSRYPNGIHVSAVARRCHGP